MYEFLPEKSLLKISRVPIPEPMLEYEDHVNYLAYKRFLSTFESVEMQYLIDGLNNIIQNLTKEKRLEIFKKSSRVIINSRENSLGGRDYAEFYLGLSSLETDTAFWAMTNGERYENKLMIKEKQFPLIKFTNIGRDGLIRRDDSKYCLVNMLIQNGTAFSNKDVPELKLAFTRNAVKLSAKSRRINATIKGKDLSALSLLFVLCNEDGMDPRAAYDMLSNNYVTNWYYRSAASADGGEVPGEQSLNMEIEYSDQYRTNKERRADFGACDFLLETDEYTLGEYRNELNEMLSLERAIGRVLFKDVTLKDGTVIPRDTKVSKKHIKLFNDNFVNRIEVYNDDDFCGWFFTERVQLPIIRQGSKIFDCISDFLPASEQSNMYVTQDYWFDNNGAFIEAGEIIEQGMIDFLRFNGYEYLHLIEEPTHKNAYKAMLYDEIVGNNTFKVGENWVYVNVDGSTRKCRDRLTWADVVASISLLVRLQDGKDFSMVVTKDIKKKVALADDIFHEAFMKATDTHLSKISRKLMTRISNRGKGGDGISSTNTTDCLLDITFMTALFAGLSKEFWSTLQIKMKVVRPIDTTNPVAFESNNNHIETILKDSKAVASEMRSISMHHYGRLCVYETPQSKKLGLTNTKAIGCKINKDGVMLVAYRVVKHLGGKSYLTDEVQWLSPREEEKFCIADITTLKLHGDEIVNDGRLLARIPNFRELEKMTVGYVDKKYINYVNVSPNGQLSITATTIPFLGSDDPVRTSFGLNMCRQAKGLVHPEKPIVTTSGFYNIPKANTYYQICAEHDGEVVDVSQNSIAVAYFVGAEAVEKQYTFEEVEFTKDALINRTCLVKEGEYIHRGQELVTSNYIVDNSLALGVNAVVAWVPDKFDYEDGVHESERLCEKLTSYGVHSEEASLKENCKFANVIQYNKMRYLRKDDEAYVVRKFFKTSKKSGKSAPVDSVVRSHSLKGFLIRFSNTYKDGGSKDIKSIEASSISFDMAIDSDKLANRHGNKGVIPRIESNNNMPRLLNGEFADLVYNQMGVISRMNVGQVKEAHVGLAGYVLGIQVMSDPLNGANVEEVATLLEFAYKLANENFEATLSAYSGVYPKALLDFLVSKKKWIQSWKGVFDENGTAIMINPVTNKPYENRVVVGINYVYKLIHEGEKKLHFRGGFLGGEPYNKKTAAPTEGASAGGGQRAGTMEFDALGAHGASALIQEKLNELGDNPIARNNHNVELLHAGDTFKIRGKGIRRSTEYFMAIINCLGLDAQFEDDTLPNYIKEEYVDYVYTAKALRGAKGVGNKRETQSEEDARALYMNGFD